MKQIKIVKTTEGEFTATLEDRELTSLIIAPLVSEHFSATLTREEVVDLMEWMINELYMMPQPTIDLKRRPTGIIDTNDPLAARKAVSGGPRVASGLAVYDLNDPKQQANFIGAQPKGPETSGS